MKQTTQIFLECESPTLTLLKVNESRYSALFVVSGSIKKIFSIDCVNTDFSQSMINYPCSISFQQI